MQNWTQQLIVYRRAIITWASGIECCGVLSKLRRKKFLGHSGMYLSGNLLQKTVSFLLIPVLTSHMRPFDYGIVGTVSAYGGVLGAIVSLGLAGAVVRHYFDFEDNPEAQRSFLMSNLFVLGLSGAVVSGALLLFGRPLWKFVSSGSIPFAPYVMLMLGSVFVSQFVPILLSLFQAQQRPRAFLVTQLSMFFCTIGCMLVFVVALNKGAYGQMVATLLTQTIFAGFTLAFFFRNYLPTHLSALHMRAGLLFGLPVVPHFLSHWALSLADRIMIERFVSIEAVGLYTLGYNLAMVLQFVVSSINQGWVPHYYAIMKERPEAAGEEVARTVSIYLACIGGMVVLGSLFTPELLALLTPPQYHGAASLIPPVAFGFLMVGLYYYAVNPLFFFKRTKWLPLLSGSAALLNIGLNLYFIPVFGAIAAAWTTLICYTFLFLAYLVLSQRLSRVPYPYLRGFVVLLLIFAVVLLSSIEQGAWFSLTMKVSMIAAYGIGSYLLLLLPVLKKKARLE